MNITVADIGESTLLTAAALTFFLPLGALGLLKRKPFVFLREQIQVIGRVTHAFITFLILISFMCLVDLFIACDFRVLAVASHCHSGMGFFYRLAATWGHHEGSMLLFSMLFALYGFSYQSYRPLLWHWGGLFLFLAYLLVTSNPFERLSFPFQEGGELNPLLQDPLLIIHPPLLYAGYAGLAVPFCLTLARGWQKDPESSYLIAMRHSLLIAWGFLTIGIGLGSFWAYYELGWGGWWFWDPVENVSFLPWLAGTALLHTLHGAKHRLSWIRGVVYLAILSYSLALLGLVLVRSGLLSSVHSFGVDPGRGTFLLAILGISMGVGGISLFKQPYLTLTGKESISFHDRSFFYMLGIIIWMVMTFTVLLGTLYPLLLQWLNLPEVSVGAPYFIQTVVPMGLLSLIPMAVVLGFAWKPLPGPAIFERLQRLVVVALLLVLVLGYTANFLSLTQWVGIFLSGLIMASIAVRPTKWPLKLAHGGFALTILGMCLDTALYHEESVALRVGESQTVKGSLFLLQHIEVGSGQTYDFERAHLVCTKDNIPILLKPEKRYYGSHRMLTTETAIHTNFLSHLYVVLGGGLPDGRWILRISIHPWVSLIWIGALLMALGAFMKVITLRRKAKQ